MKIDYKANILKVGNSDFVLEFPIKALKVIGDKIIVIHDPASGPAHRQFNNCKAYDLNGYWIWTAEHPTNQTADVYLDFVSSDSLLLWNFACFICEINTEDGRLINFQFTK